MYAKARNAREGFTLIEILIAVAIIAILGIIVAPNLLNRVAKAGETGTKSSLRALKTAISEFKLDLGEFPDKLRDLVKKPSDEKFKKWKASYLEASEVPQDSWGNSFYYKKPGEKGHPYELSSYGPNGKSGPKEERISVWDL